MGKRYNFANIADSQDFGLIPMGRYPARLHVDAYQHDTEGNFMTDGAGDKCFWQTNKGDDLWKLTFDVLDTEHAGRKVFDNLNFSQGGLKRVKIIFMRVGYGDDYEGELDPDDLDGSYWFINVDSHEVYENARSPSKYIFKNKNGCKCETCRTYEVHPAESCKVCEKDGGHKVRVNAKIGFAGFDPMPAKDAAMYKATTPGPDADPDKESCLACSENDHSHTAGKGCPCLNIDHPPF